MTRPDAQPPDHESPDFTAGLESFALHEYDHLAASLVANEETGEKRVQFYVAILTAAFGIVGLAFRNPAIPLALAVREAWLPLFIVLAVLFMFGVSTLFRIVERNLATDRYKFALRALRRRFVSSDVAKRHPAAFFQPYTRQKRRSVWPIKGGWLDVVALLNAAVLALAVWIVTARFVGGPVGLGASLLAAAVVLPWQLLYVAGRYAKEWTRLEEADEATDAVTVAPS
jgi:hypothetical protein